jgi:hypothetical protein
MGFVTLRMTGRHFVVRYDLVVPVCHIQASIRAELDVHGAKIFVF